ncbi:MAG: hypothetical protein HYZ51_03585 [Candidatus Doudnabacteria bacterium]|nr:hypothetical protein [Candidatus Doudnabacteria bacterium]
MSTFYSINSHIQKWTERGNPLKKQKKATPAPFRKGSTVTPARSRDVKAISERTPAVKVGELVKVRAAEWDCHSGHWVFFTEGANGGCFDARELKSIRKK